MTILPYLIFLAVGVTARVLLAFERRRLRRVHRSSAASLAVLAYRPPAAAEVRALYRAARRFDEWRGGLDGRPTLWIKRLATWRGRVLDLHKMVAADGEGCFHTHPAFAVRLILWGGYVEEIEGGARRAWRPGMAGVVAPACSHRIAALRNGRCSYSLWLRFRKRAHVTLRGAGWPAGL